MRAGRDVLAWRAGLKAAQLLLEASLIYLIISDWRRSRRQRGRQTNFAGL